MIWWPWLLVVFGLGFAWAVYLAREEHNRQQKKIQRLLRDLYDTQAELAKANRMLHGQQHPGDEWKWNDPRG